MTGAFVIAANPGPAAHIALLGAIIIIGLIVYAIARIRRRREATEAERLNREDAIEQPSSPQPRRVIRYALLGYDLDGSLEQLTSDAKRSLHRKHAELAEPAPVGRTVKLIAHYRFRPSPIATVRHHAGTATRSDRAASEASARLRALYILDSDDPDAVIQLAEQLPATLQGATIEIWPLTEPRASH